MGKADRVIAHAEKCDPVWKYELSEDGDRTSIKLTRGDEEMTINWVSGMLEHPLTYQLRGVRAVRLRNVSAALKQMSERPNYKARTRRTASAEAEPSTKAEPARTTLPFSIEEDDNKTIIKALRGRTVTWRNTMNGDYEVGMVPDRFQVEVSDGAGGKKKVWRTNPNITIKTTSSGRRVLTWPDSTPGYPAYRSCGLDQIVSVS